MSAIIGVAESRKRIIYDVICERGVDWTTTDGGLDGGGWQRQWREGVALPARRR